MTHHVFSTLSTDHVYGSNAAYEKGKANFKKKAVLIHGKANVINKALQTPKGVMTSVSDEDFEVISKDPIFQLHVKNGFIDHTKKAADPEKFADKNLEGKDGSAQLTAADFKDSPNTPVVNKGDDEEEGGAGDDDTGKE